MDSLLNMVVDAIGSQPTQPPAIGSDPQMTVVTAVEDGAEVRSVVSLVSLSVVQLCGACRWQYSGLSSKDSDWILTKIPVLIGSLARLTA